MAQVLSAKQVTSNSRVLLVHNQESLNMRFLTPIFLGAVILFFPLLSSAMENNNLERKCDNKETLQSCIIKQSEYEEGKFDIIEIYNLPKDLVLVKAHDAMLSGVYNSLFSLFIFDKNQQLLFPLSYEKNNRFGVVDLYNEGLIFYDSMKGRGMADVGYSAFYKIDLEKKSLVRIAYFSTDNPQVKNEAIYDKYIDENGNEDKELGYDDRGEKYKKDNKLQKIKLTEIYNEQGAKK